MNSFAVHLSFAALAGLALGFFYFGGLWLTVRRIPCSGNPGILVVGSYIVRLLVTLCGMYLVMDGEWERLIACLAGFLATRVVLLRLARPGEAEAGFFRNSGC